jgi:predicted metal-dependent hydrolase
MHAHASEEREYTLQKNIDFTLKRSKRARTMRLAIYPDGNVVVTAPTFFGVSVIESFIEKHAAWVRAKVAETRGRTILRISRASIPDLKKQAHSFIRERVQECAAYYGVTPGRISVRAQKSRWGSCSQHGNLSFNYKIVLLPERLAAYIIAHEVCHIRQFDHSKKFWDLVALQFPDHRKLRAQLRNTATIFIP